MSPDASYSNRPIPDGVADRLRYAIAIATLAPSEHNTQPWLFHVEDASIQVFADRSRALPVVDPCDRELVMSCGAAIHHLRTCLAAMGEHHAVTLLPDDGDPDLLAVVRVHGRGEPLPLAKRWLEAAGKRRTTRCVFEGWCVSPVVIETLRGACAHAGATLYVLDTAARRTLVDLVREGDREQLADKAFRRELAAWVHPNRSRHRDGMPGYAQGLGDCLSTLGPFVVRTFDIGDSQAAKDEQLLEHSPVLAVIGTTADDPRSHIHAGEALSALLLEGTSSGLAASFLNQPIELPSLRSKVAELLCASAPVYPQCIVRMGYYAGPSLQPTPRRELEAVLC